MGSLLGELVISTTLTTRLDIIEQEKDVNLGPDKVDARERAEHTLEKYERSSIGRPRSRPSSRPSSREEGKGDWGNNRGLPTHMRLGLLTLRLS